MVLVVVLVAVVVAVVLGQERQEVQALLGKVMLEALVQLHHNMAVVVAVAHPQLEEMDRLQMVVMVVQEQIGNH
jgi:hypothetical protein